MVNVAIPAVFFFPVHPNFDPTLSHFFLVSVLNMANLGGVHKRFKPKPIFSTKAFDWGNVIRWYSSENGISTIPPRGYLAMFSSHRELDDEVDITGASGGDLIFEPRNSIVPIDSSDPYYPVLPQKLNTNLYAAVCLNSLAPYKHLSNHLAAGHIYGAPIYGSEFMASMYSTYRVTSATLVCRPQTLGPGNAYDAYTIRFGMLVLDTNDNSVAGFTDAELRSTIIQRRDMGKLKTIPISNGSSFRFNSISVNVNIMDWYAGRVVSSDFSLPPNPSSAIDVTDVINFTGTLPDPATYTGGDFQAQIASASLEPPVKVFVIPFFWLERPNSIATAAQSFFVPCQFDLIQHVHFSSPRRGFFKDAPYESV